MRVLLLNQFFFPDAVATSQLLTDVAQELSSNGHAVRAVCCRSAYGTANTGELPGVTVIRTWAAPFGHGAATRLLSYISYLIGALWHGMWGPPPDAVLSLTTPPVLPLIGRTIAKLRGARHYVWEMDVYPDIAVALGVLKERSWFTRLIGVMLDCQRRHSAGVIVLGDCMKERLVRRGVPCERMVIAENWADSRDIQRCDPPASGPFTLLYSGNLGLAHDLDTFLETLARLGEDPRFRFVFAGGGPQRSRLEAFCTQHGTRNIEFCGYRPRQELTASFADCHAGLVTQKPESLGAVVPSKVYGLMAAGRPVVYVGPVNATPAALIRKYGCGWQVEPGSSNALTALLLRLADNPAEARDVGERAYVAFQQDYDRPAGVARICRAIGCPVRDQTLTLQTQ